MPERNLTGDSTSSHIQHRMSPHDDRERIVAIDVLRGFALLGILLMNIQSFAMIEAAYFVPMAYGDLSGLNLVVWWLSTLLASSKFMTLFSMLFGAGVILQTTRAERAGRSLRAVYYRRLFWLWLFGLVHAYIFWGGDILVTYAVAGVLLYPLRRLRAGWLLALGLVLLVVGSGLYLASGLTAEFWSADQVTDFRNDWKPPPDAVQAELDAMRSGWWDEIRYRAPHVLELHLFIIPYHLFWRGCGMMLLGMALFKWGLLTGGRRRAYGLWIALSLLVGLPLTAYGTWRQFASDWEIFSAFFIDSQFNYWASLLVALGWAGLVFTAIERRWLPGLQVRLAAVGRTALSNYLLHTLIATTLFYGRGFGLFGSVSRLTQLGIVVAIWLLQLWLAPWWLRRYRMGPAEWLWRTLTYLQRPAMRR